MFLHCFVEEIEEIPSVKDKPQGGCPNAWNKFHTCVAYCKERWGGDVAQQQKSNKSKVWFFICNDLKYICAIYM